MPGKRDLTPGCLKEGESQEIRSRLYSAAETAEKKEGTLAAPFNIHHWGDYTLLGPCGLLAGVGHHLEQRKVISYACKNLHSSQILNATCLVPLDYGRIPDSRAACSHIER